MNRLYIISMVLSFYSIHGMNGIKNGPGPVMKKSNFSLENALIDAASTNNQLEAKKLIAQKANVNYINYHGDSPLKEAIKHGHPQLAQFLIQQGAQPSEDIAKSTENIYLNLPAGSPLNKEYVTLLKTMGYNQIPIKFTNSGHWKLFAHAYE